jgi:hypothetical protein
LRHSFLSARKIPSNALGDIANDYLLTLNIYYKINTLNIQGNTSISAVERGEELVQVSFPLNIAKWVLYVYMATVYLGKTEELYMFKRKILESAVKQMPTSAMFSAYIASSSREFFWRNRPFISPCTANYIKPFALHIGCNRSKYRSIS